MNATTEAQMTERMSAHSVLMTMIGAGPSPLHEDEIIKLELGGSPQTFGLTDRVRVLLGELVGNGLVHQLEGFYWPTQAARAFEGDLP